MTTICYDLLRLLLCFLLFVDVRCFFFESDVFARESEDEEKRREK